MKKAKSKRGPKPKIQSMTFRVPKEVKKLLEDAAENDGRSVTSWVIKNWRDQLDPKAGDRTVGTPEVDGEATDGEDSSDDDLEKAA